MPVFGPDAFGVELHALDGQRLVPQAHDRAVRQFCRHLQHIGQAGAVDHQRMIARGQKRCGQAPEHAKPRVMDLAHLAMHDFAVALDGAAKGLADGLMAKAHPQKRHTCAGRGPRQRKADARLRRIAGARRQHDGGWLPRQRVLHRDLVVAHNLRLGPQLAQIMDKVQVKLS